MRFYLGVTDSDWFRSLRAMQPDDINFWQPSGRRLTGLEKGEPFLFKLKAPYNRIGGMGFFSTFAALPLSIAWDAFGLRNGCADKVDFRSKIIRYRQKNNAADDPTLTIGCIIVITSYSIHYTKLYDVNGNAVRITSSLWFEM